MRKSGGICFSYINKSIKEFDIKKLKFINKKISFFALEQLIEKKVLFLFYYIILNFFQNLILYFILKQKVKNEIRKIFLIFIIKTNQFFFGRSLMRSLIYDQHFKFIISKFNE